MHKGHLQGVLYTRIAELNDIHEGTEAVANPMDQSISSLVIIGQIEYGLSAGWVLQGVLPYLDQTFRTSGTVTQENGLGDLSIMAYYMPEAALSSPWHLRFGAGLTVPVGRGVENPISSDKNLISETVDPLFAASFLYSTLGRVSLNGGLFARPILTTAGDGTRTGSFLQGSLNVEYGLPSARMAARIGLRGVYRLPDVVAGAEFPNSGGRWLYLTPAMTWIIAGQGIHGMQLTVSAEIPVVQDVRGTQLVEDRIYAVRLFYGLGG